LNKLIKKQKGFALMTEIVTVIAAVGIIGSMALTQSNEPIIKAQAAHGLQHIFEGIVKVNHKYALTGSLDDADENYSITSNEQIVAAGYTFDGSSTFTNSDGDMDDIATIYAAIYDAGWTDAATTVWLDDTANDWDAFQLANGGTARTQDCASRYVASSVVNENGTNLVTFNGDLAYDDDMQLKTQCSETNNVLKSKSILAVPFVLSDDDGLNPELKWL
jgi:hypothetical protein